MGMFDRVWARCPKCGTPVEFQSKSGDCILADYNIDNVPADVAAGIYGDSEVCGGCGNVLRAGKPGDGRVSIPIY